jgi:hypothetical protein
MDYWGRRVEFGMIETLIMTMCNTKHEITFVMSVATVWNLDVLYPADFTCTECKLPTSIDDSQSEAKYY